MKDFLFIPLSYLIYLTIFQIILMSQAISHYPLRLMMYHFLLVNTNRLTETNLVKFVLSVAKFHLPHLRSFISVYFCLIPLFAVVPNHHHLPKRYSLRLLECSSEVCLLGQGYGFFSLSFLDELMEKMGSSRSYRVVMAFDV
jgi:hypothetical protein